MAYTGCIVAYSEEAIAAWGEQIEKGLSNRKVAAMFGVDPETIGRHFPGRVHVTHTPEAIAKWEECLDDGMGYKNVGEVFGVSAETVRKYLPGRAMKHSELISLGNAVRKANEKMRSRGFRC